MVIDLPHDVAGMAVSQRPAGGPIVMFQQMVDHRVAGADPQVGGCLLPDEAEVLLRGIGHLNFVRNASQEGLVH